MTVHQLIPLDLAFDVRARLADLQAWDAIYRQEEQQLQARTQNLDPENEQDLMRAMQIGSLLRQANLRRVRSALEITSNIATVGSSALREHLAGQYLTLTQEERLLWLNNLLFIMTPELRDLEAKIGYVRAYRAFGQQRNFLLGGPSGTGKSTFLDWYLAGDAPTVEATRNHIPILKIDAPLKENTPKPLFQRLILECGATYFGRDSEETLLMKLILCVQKCGVEVLIVDEVEHLSRPRIRRRLLEISNLTRGIPIICAACHPEHWVEGDAEIRGRWNDHVTLTPFTGKRLQQLLAFIELLLPCTEPSLLAFADVPGEDGAPQAGLARLIEHLTGGILRDIMLLVHEATAATIRAHEPYVTATCLEAAWKRIQNQPVSHVQEASDATSA